MVPKKITNNLIGSFKKKRFLIGLFDIVMIVIPVTFSLRWRFWSTRRFCHYDLIHPQNRNRG